MCPVAAWSAQAEQMNERFPIFTNAMPWKSHDAARGWNQVDLQNRMFFRLDEVGDLAEVK
jgi:hypothetical protein